MADTFESFLSSPSGTVTQDTIPYGSTFEDLFSQDAYSQEDIQAVPSYEDPNSFMNILLNARDNIERGIYKSLSLFGEDLTKSNPDVGQRLKIFGDEGIARNIEQIQSRPEPTREIGFLSDDIFADIKQEFSEGNYWDGLVRTGQWVKDSVALGLGSSLPILQFAIPAGVAGYTVGLPVTSTLLASLVPSSLAGKSFVYEEAKELNASEEKAREYSNYGGLIIGLLDAVLPAYLVQTSLKTIGKDLTKKVIKNKIIKEKGEDIARNLGKDAVEEVSEEFAETAIKNATKYKYVAPSIISTALKTSAKTGLAEGVTESLQEAAQIGSAGLAAELGVAPYHADVIRDRIIDSGLIGIWTGKTLGAGIGTVKGVSDVNTVARANQIDADIEQAIPAIKAFPDALADISIGKDSAVAAKDTGFIDAFFRRATTPLQNFARRGPEQQRIYNMINNYYNDVSAEVGVKGAQVEKSLQLMRRYLKFPIFQRSVSKKKNDAVFRYLSRGEQSTDSKLNEAGSLFRDLLGEEINSEIKISRESLKQSILNNVDALPEVQQALTEGRIDQTVADQLNNTFNEIKQTYNPRFNQVDPTRFVDDQNVFNMDIDIDSFELVNDIIAQLDYDYVGADLNRPHPIPIIFEKIRNRIPRNEWNNLYRQVEALQNKYSSRVFSLYYSEYFPKELFPEMFEQGLASLQTEINTDPDFIALVERKDKNLDPDFIALAEGKIPFNDQFVDQSKARVLLDIEQDPKFNELADRTLAPAELTGILKDLNDTGIDMGNVKNYFPRSYKTTFPWQRKKFKSVLRQFGMTEIEADIILGNIKENGGVYIPEDAKISIDPYQTEVVKDHRQGFEKKRKITTEVFEALDNAGLVERNVPKTINKYIVEATQRQKIKDLAKIINSNLKQLGPNAISNKELSLMRDIFDAIQHNYNPIRSERIKKTQRHFLTYQYMLTLPLAALTALTEPLIVLSRVGPTHAIYGGIKAAQNTLRQGMRSVFPKIPLSEAEEAARSILQLYDGTLAERLGNIAGVDVNRKWTDKFFRTIMLTQVTQLSRDIALQAGLRQTKQDIVSVIRGNTAGKLTKGQTLAKKRLLEMGLVEENFNNPEVVAWIEGGARGRPPLIINKAMSKFVDEIIMAPNVVNRPLWMSDPHYAMISQLKGFMFTFGNTVGMRLWREVFKPLAKGRIPLGEAAKYAMAFTLIVGGSIAIKDMKDWIRYGDDDSPWKESEGISKLVQALIDSNIFGPGTVMYDALLSMQYGVPPVGVILGPGVQWLSNLLAAMGSFVTGEPRAIARFINNAVFPPSIVSGTRKREVIDRLEQQLRGPSEGLEELFTFD